MANKNIRLYDYTIIDKKTVQMLFSEYDSKIEVANFTLIPEGLSTSNYMIEIKNTSKTYLLKNFPENGGNSEIERA